jgi:hypothetical protein
MVTRKSLKTDSDRVPQTIILAFRNCDLRNAREAEDSFYYLWKQYLAKAGGKRDSVTIISVDVEK